MNQFLQHYISNEITPIKQDISDLQKHFSRRISLYQTLGLPALFFKDKKVLEVGPGGGYNPLVTQSLGLKKYDLVEPNKYGVEDIEKIFSKYNVDRTNISISNCMLEDFKATQKYDVIICEGMIPGLHNKEEVLKKLDDLLSTNGVIILTCIDEVAYLFEILRHYIASKLVDNSHSFDEKLDIFEKAFSPHLDTLHGMSRFKRDWCADNLMGTMHFNYNFSLKECMDFFNNRYKYYNSSPNLFTEYRWYKEIPSDITKYNEYFIKQFAQQRHNLLHYKVVSNQRSREKNDELVSLAKSIFLLIEDSILNGNDKNNDILCALDKICINIEDDVEDKIIYDSLNDVRTIIQENDFSADSISSKYKNFMGAFGRGTQYISIIKEDSDVK